MRNLITEFKAFYERKQFKPIDKSAQLLWFTLLYICNMSAWQEWFTVASQTIEIHSGLNKHAIIRARNNLKQQGYIDFRTNGNKATSYKLITICRVKNDTANDTTNDTANDTANDTINILNYTIRDDNNIPVTTNVNEEDSDFQKLCRRVGEEICQVTMTIQDDISFALQNVDKDLVDYAIEQTVRLNKHNWKYTYGIIRRCVAENIFTGAEARRREAEYHGTGSARADTADFSKFFKDGTTV